MGLGSEIQTLVKTLVQACPEGSSRVWRDSQIPQYTPATQACELTRATQACQYTELLGWESRILYLSSWPESQLFVSMSILSYSGVRVYSVSMLGKLLRETIQYVCTQSQVPPWTRLSPAYLWYYVGLNSWCAWSNCSFCIRVFIHKKTKKFYSL